jgi:hypothetical protein
VIIDAGGGDVGVAEPLLDLGDVGFVVERVGGGRRPKRVGANLEAEIGRIAAHDLVDGIGRKRLLEAAGTVVLARTEQGAALVRAVPGGLKVIVDELVRARAVQAEGQGLQACAARRAASQGRRQGREDAVSATAPYPPHEWSNDQLYDLKGELHDEGRAQAESLQYTDAAKTRAAAREIAALLFARGDLFRQQDADAVKLDMARVIVGEGPQPQILAGQPSEPGALIKPVWEDPATNLTILEQYSHAAHYAMSYYLATEIRAQLGLNTQHVTLSGYSEPPAPEPQWPQQLELEVYSTEPEDQVGVDNLPYSALPDVADDLRDTDADPAPPTSNIDLDLG